MSTIHVFVSYSHEDSLWVQEGPSSLIPWLARSLKRDGVELWYDHALKQLPGVEYKKLIQGEIDKAHFALLLISQDFVNSDFIHQFELPWIKQRVQRNEQAIIPILVGPVAEDELEWLGERQMLPGKPTPLIDYVNDLARWKHVQFEILRAIKHRIREFREFRPRPEEEMAEEESEQQEESPQQTSQPAPGTTDETLPVAPRRQVILTHKVTTNSISMNLVLIPSGEFLMGSPDSDEDAYYNEKPQHRVKITQPFYLGEHPVTQEQYERVVRSNPSRFQGARCPVENVSWFDAVQFCNRLSLQERLPPCYRITGNSVSVVEERGYRLPTEAEWEYACRAGTATKWSFGDNASDLDRYAWCKTMHGTTHPAGEKEPNPWGFYDMHGNVYEWCWDCFEEGFYANSPPCDPSGPESGENRVLRGGAYAMEPRMVRSAVRFSHQIRHEYFGFRVARGQ